MSPIHRAPFTFSNSFDAFQGGQEGDGEHHRLQPDQSDREQDESRLALLDTACTACLHSKRWRESYMRSLPKGVLCQQTPAKKLFHFANGASSDGKLPVWRIPIFLGSRLGEVFSAELPSGTTPLLLSIPAMSALDMVLMMKDRVVEVRTLSLELPMVTTRTNHLAVEVAFRPGAELPKNLAMRTPTVANDAGDLLVYYLEEARQPVLHGLPCRPSEKECQAAPGELPKLGSRGVKCGDVLGELPDRRARELRRAEERHNRMDRCMWTALRMEVNMAEQWATQNFSKTWLFEPLDSEAPITRYAAERLGWTCTRPMDRLDGADLYGPAGRRLLRRALAEHQPFLTVLSFRQSSRSGRGKPAPKHDSRPFAVETARRQHQGGRYYLMAAPSQAHEREERDSLLHELQPFGGKLAWGDLCAYQEGAGSRRRQLMCWISNSELLLNHLGKRCSCAWGTHKAGTTSTTTTLGRPSPGLCRAICQGIQETMCLDYGIAFAQADAGHYAFPAGDLQEEGEFESVTEAEEEPVDDDWRFEGDDLLVRVHRAPRRLLFIPYSSTAPPCPFQDILPGRRTRMLMADGTRRVHEGDWWHGRRETMDQEWTGETEFRLRRPGQPQQTEPTREEPLQEETPVPETPALMDSALPYDSAVPFDQDLEEMGQPQQTVPAREEPLQEGPNLVKDERALRRRGHRTRQLQRGLWVESTDDELAALLEATLDYVRQEGGDTWNRLDLQGDLGKAWASRESATAEVQLALCSAILTTDWEDWASQAPSAQVRPLVAQRRSLYVVLYGKDVGEVENPEADDRWKIKEQARERQWNNLPREMKLAIKRVHVNLGHASTASMLRALRISRASEVALKACRLFRCPDCAHMSAPKEPRPSKLPMTDEFNVQIGLDILTEKDSKGQGWSWLNILDQGTTFQTCALLGETHANPTGLVVLEALTTHWTSWAGFPERGVMTDRAKYFLAEFAEEFSSHGCTFDSAAKASPWQLGQIERHGGLWKESFRKLAWAQQVAGREEVLLATVATTQAKNSCSRKGGFSPMQWVLGREIRLPAALCDDSEVARIGAQALAATPTTQFFRKTQLRMAAREAFAKASNSEVLRRAELRQVRPSRGPFPVGSYVFYYDAAGKEPGPSCWRGVARGVGREGSHTVWLSHRGILLAVSPEHLSRAFDEEVNRWTITAHEVDLIDPAPASGGTGFIDLRKAPKPPDEPDELPGGEGSQPLPEERSAQRKRDAEDLSSSSTSMARMRWESERDAKKARQSSEFFRSQERKRRPEGGVTSNAPPEPPPGEQPLPDDVDQDLYVPSPIGLDLPPATEAMTEWDPDLDDYHVPPSDGVLPPLPAMAEEPGAEAQEREAKRQRVLEGAGETANYVQEGVCAFTAATSRSYIVEKAQENYHKHELSYMAAGITLDEYLFGVRRNVFQDKYEALAAQDSNPVKKKGRKELRLSELPPETQALFTGPEGSDAKEWAAWRAKDACDMLSPAESARVRAERPELIVPTRWVRTNKNDGLVAKDFLAKSRLVVQGFKDKALGQYRRDAPTASAMAESVCLAVCVHMQFVLFAKDIKNAYFSGKSVDREIYLDQPRGGLPGLSSNQLLRAKKAIYGFAEAARLFWLALREHLESDGWKMSRLEPALFYLRRDRKLIGILVTHVDDIEGGVHPKYLDKAFYHSSRALEFATNHYKDFIFRGREVKQTPEGHIDVSMRNYALSMKPIKVTKEQRQQLDRELTPQEMEVYNSAAGELGWVSRQLRCDIAFENGVAQRSKLGTCMADLVRLKQYIAMSRRGADFRMRYWKDVDLSDGVILHLADSGHANGSPDHNDILRYRSVGGYFILIANRCILEGKPSRANVLAFHSGQTKRVCRSTLAAEASHLAEAVEAGDWLTVLLEEALTNEVDLKSWPEVIERRDRVYVTDARSVYDYLEKDSHSTSSDRRMAIEGALLRETVKRPRAHVRWIDGMQNMADVLTKANADKEVLRQYLKDGVVSLVQTDANRLLKEKKRGERQKRKVVIKAKTSGTQQEARKDQAIMEAEKILAEAEGESD
eukprot:s217_g2.t2